MWFMWIYIAPAINQRTPTKIYWYISNWIIKKSLITNSLLPFSTMKYSEENANVNKSLQLEDLHFFANSFLKGVKKKGSVVTFSVVEGLIIIVQQCYTPSWKALDVSFQVITEPFCVKNTFWDIVKSESKFLA